MTAPFGGRRLVVDTSAFQRGGRPAVREAWVRALGEGQLYTTPLLQLEVLYSARNPREYAEHGLALPPRREPRRLL